MSRASWVVFVCLFFSLAGVVSAAETDNVIINTTITGSDVVAPSVPANVSATALSLDSIQVEWDASTDNFGVTGYHVWRDGSIVATTTMLTFLDSGLASSTAYSYYITAFDAVGNESASSTVVTATTFANVIQEDPVSGTDTTESFAIRNLEIEPSQNDIFVSFTTDRYAYAEVSWEQGGALLGTVQSDGMRKQHEVLIPGLQPNTTYTVTITIHSATQQAVVTRDIQVTTAALPDTTPPDNVRNLSAVETERGIELRWQNPSASDFSYVRVLRSTRFFPTDMVDGWVIYEGNNTTYVDTVSERPVYYTVFAVDGSGNVSSGAVIVVYAGAVGTTGTIPLPTPTSTLPVVPPDFSIEPALTTWPVYIAQGDRVTRLSTSTVFSLSPDQPFAVRIPATAVPEHLKTIVGTLTHPDETQGSFQFLLRRSADGSSYEALVGSLDTRGQYQLQIQWFDFNTRKTGSVEGLLTLVAQPSVQQATIPQWQSYLIAAIGGLILLLILRIIWMYERRRAV